MLFGQFPRMHIMVYQNSTYTLIYGLLRKRITPLPMWISEFVLILLKTQKKYVATFRSILKSTDSKTCRIF